MIYIDILDAAIENPDLTARWMALFTPNSIPFMSTFRLKKGGEGG